MRRIAIVFLVAVFVPAMVLGFLALRAAREQRTVLEQQSVELYRKDADLLAAQLSEAVLARQREFAGRVRVLLSSMKPYRLAIDFDTLIGEPPECASFVVAPDGAIVPPTYRSRLSVHFLRENEAFLSNRASAEFFPTQQAAVNISQNVKIASNLAFNGGQMIGNISTLNGSADLNANYYNGNTYQNSISVGNSVSNATTPTSRKVQPQKLQAQSDVDAQQEQISRVASQTSDFQTATSGGTDGVLARFAQNELELIFWTRPPEAGGYVFGLALPAKAVTEFVREAFSAIDPTANNACLAVLDEKAVPIATSRPGFRADWKRPFVSSEIGETLPHWEAALYLLKPDQLVRSAHVVTLTLILLVALALAAILAGGSFVALDARSQLVLAQKKTDFVSNVSHELKTPLTSIRMFAELLEQGRVAEPEKRSRYLRIITLESERLTRLINNVLDFARMEKKRKTYRKALIDLHPVIERAWEAQSAHLRESGFECEWIAGDPPYQVMADADAIGQVIVNLLSNAEKYAGERHEIALHTWKDSGQVHIAVLDRGIGVPAGDERRIFEAFHRSNDSLASNVQGSGLGLTLARRIAADHGGDVDFRRRDGGGSAFTLRLPLAKPGDTA